MDVKARVKWIAKNVVESQEGLAGAMNELEHDGWHVHQVLDDVREGAYLVLAWKRASDE